MTTIKIDNIDYDTHKLSDEAKAQLISLQFCDQELARLLGDARQLIEEFPDHSNLALLLDEMLARVPKIKMDT